MWDLGIMETSDYVRASQLLENFKAMILTLGSNIVESTSIIEINKKQSNKNTPQNKNKTKIKTKNLIKTPKSCRGWTTVQTQQIPVLT